MPHRASDLLRTFREGGLLLELRGPDAAVERVAAADACGPGDLVFADRAEYLEAALRGGASAIVTTAKLADCLGGGAGAALLICRDVKLAWAQVTQRHFDRDLRPPGVPPIHPRAILHPEALVAATARIGAGAVVEAGARIGERCVLLAHAVIEEGAQVGEGTVVHPAAVVGHGCLVGRDVILKSGAVIGSEGFGFAQDAARRNHRIPQLGTVVVGDRVVVGANCCIDRPPHGTTRIGNGTVIDNLCHIAHGVQVGEDCILTAMLCVAGSTRLGDRVVTSGMTGIIDHLEIASDVTLLQKAGVTGDVPEAGAYAGMPLLPLKEHMKRQALLLRLPQLREELRALERRIAELEGGAGGRAAPP